MKRFLIKLLLIIVVALPVVYFGIDYLKFRFPFGAGSYAFAEGYGFNCDYKVLKERINILSNTADHQLPELKQLREGKIENSKYIYFYYRPAGLVFSCLIDSACCNTSGISLIAVAYLDAKRNSLGEWKTVNDNNQVGWKQNKWYLNTFQDNVIDKLKADLPRIE